MPLFRRSKPFQSTLRIAIGVILILSLFLIHHFLTESPELRYARTVDLDDHPATSTKEKATIPKIVHFVFGLKEPNPSLDIISYVAIKSAHDVLKPDQIMFHYHYMPTGELWDELKPLLTLKKVRLVDTIFGRPVGNYAHKSDIIRMEALLEHGGIYLDSDVISLKSVDHLLEYKFVMAQEGLEGSVGLGNSVMMAQKGAHFLKRWYASYKAFNTRNWNHHSVVLPWQLAQYYPSEIYVLDHTAFFSPLWDKDGLRTMYLEKSYDFAKNLGTHIWHSAAQHNLLKDATKEVILNIDNSLYCQMRPFLLNNQPDPRPGACRILENTERQDRLVGSWHIDHTPSNTNPFRLDDLSGNDVSGMVRNGHFDSLYHSVGLDGKLGYIFLPMPTKTTPTSLTLSWWMRTSDSKENAAAAIIQTKQRRIKVLTRAVSGSSWTGRQLSLAVSVDTLFPRDSRYPNVLLELPVGASLINGDNEFHHFALVTDNQPSQHTTPRLILYMDGVILSAGNIERELLDTFGPVKCIWLGGGESEFREYQDEWDERYSLAANYADIKVWERSLSILEIKDEYKNGRRKMDSVIDTSLDD